MLRWHEHPNTGTHTHKFHWHPSQWIHEPRFWAIVAMVIVFGLMIALAIWTAGGRYTGIERTMPMYPYLY